MKQILLVDDEPNILLSLEFLFRKEAYDVRIARDGVEAMEQIAAGPPDLIVLDIMMPNVDGYQVCSHVKEHFGHVKVVFLSAKSNASDIEAGLARGADLYLTKPFSTKELVRQVKHLLN
ncbi:response regulator transcription factor [Lunatimonas salinarum]|uniref:response regulator transcription factor n=1 Tax=Lunatimonas salinarum TaxID=1774590 RepID=UPI001ADFF8DD|nr:response regulator [Lunatimonas salinarum]